MIDEVGELFGQSGDAASVRTWPILLTLFAGLTLIGLGLFLSVVPGVIVVLAAHAMVDKEAERLRNGFLPVSAAGAVKGLRIASTIVLVICVLAVFLQGWMVWRGLFASWIYTLLDLAGLLHGFPDA